jgi:hypothetical protein
VPIPGDPSFAEAAPGQVSEKPLAEAFVAQRTAMPEGFEGVPFAAGLMARLSRRLVVDTLCPAATRASRLRWPWDSRRSRTPRKRPLPPPLAASEEHPAARDLDADRPSKDSLPAVQLEEVWAEDVGAQLLVCAAMTARAQPPPLAPVRLGAVARWSPHHLGPDPAGAGGGPSGTGSIAAA